MLLAIDPGVSTGWALFKGRDLFMCAQGDPPFIFAVTSLIIERPQVYPKTSTKQANDLITLAIQVGGYLARFQGVDSMVVLPHQWKGSIPKDIHHPRIWAKLDAAEQAIVDHAWKGRSKKGVTDIMDAVGLGLYALN